MKWAKIFTASFEESLNLQDDAISGKFSQANYESALKKEQYRGTAKSYVWLMILTLVFIFGVNYLLAFLNNYLFSQRNSQNYTILLSDINFLPYSVFWTGSFLWIILIVLGKQFNQRFILIYRGQFHMMVTYVIWLAIEMNLFFLTMLARTMTPLGVVLFLSLTILSIYLIIRSRMISILNLFYKEMIQKTFLDRYILKIVSLIIKYGWFLVPLGLVFRFIFPEKSNLSIDWVGVLSVLAIWYALNLLITVIEVYFIFPYMLQGYYKLKYPEQYREWEGKNAEEWYGNNYLKKKMKGE